MISNLLSYKSFFLVILLFSFACNSNTKKPIAETKKTDSTNIDVDANWDRESIEKIYALCDSKKRDLSDELINKICNLNTAHEPTKKIDKIYSTSHDFSNSYSFIKLFFRKNTHGNGIQAGFLYNDAGTDYYYEVQWFYLLGNKDIVSVFKYDDNHNGRWNGNILVIISKDETGNYFTDILSEDCGNDSCGMWFMYNENKAYIDLFKDIKSYQDFKKNYLRIKKIIAK